MDVLPNSFCSNYFVYDPDYRWLEFGKFSALVELQWQRLVRATSKQALPGCPHSPAVLLLLLLLVATL